MAATKIKETRPFGPRGRVQVVNTSPSRAKQSFKDECNINNIVSKYQKTGAVTHFNKNAPRYEDASGADFQDAMNLVTSTQQLFNELPSSLRARFANDPSQFLDFVQDPRNADEMAELGLRKAQPMDLAKNTAQGDTVADSEQGDDLPEDPPEKPKKRTKDS